MIWALHGAVGRAADWQDFAASMGADLRSQVGQVRRLDLWRFLDCCPMPLDKIGATLASEISRIDPSPVLVAYSMGGRLALHALLAEPKLWRAAVIISAHPGLTEPLECAARRQKDAEWSALALKGEWADFLEQWNAQGVLSGQVEMPDRMALKGRRASIARSFVDWSLGAQKDLSPSLGQIQCPVLWLSGERDVKFTQLAAQSVSKIPEAKHQVIPDCGHRIPWEQPEVFTQVCGDFLIEQVSSCR